MLKEKQEIKEKGKKKRVEEISQNEREKIREEQRRKIMKEMKREKHASYSSCRNLPFGGRATHDSRDACSTKGIRTESPPTFI